MAGGQAAEAGGGQGGQDAQTEGELLMQLPASDAPEDMPGTLSISENVIDVRGE